MCLDLRRAKRESAPGDSSEQSEKVCGAGFCRAKWGSVLGGLLQSKVEKCAEHTSAEQSGKVCQADFCRAKWGSVLGGLLQSKAGKCAEQTSAEQSRKVCRADFCKAKRGSVRGRVVFRDGPFSGGGAGGGSRFFVIGRKPSGAGDRSKPDKTCLAFCVQSRLTLSLRYRTVIAALTTNGPKRAKMSSRPGKGPRHPGR